MDFLKLLEQIDDAFEMDEEEYTAKYGQTESESWLTDPEHGKVVDWWPGDGYHHPCPVYEDGYIDHSYGYMGD